MFQLEKLLGARTTITIDQANRIRALVADWQLLADLSFADLILWVPIRKDVSMWPTGHIAVAHIRPTTTSTPSLTLAPNGAVHVLCHIMREVLSSAAEAELGALFHNCQTGIIF